MSLERRTPLARGKGSLTRTPLARGTSSLSRGGGLARGQGLARGKPMERGNGPARTRMKPSYRPAAHSREHWEEVIIPGLLTRSGGRCEVTGVDLDSGVRWSVQHRVSRNMGGTRDPNVDRWDRLLLVTGDGTTGAHGWIEHNPRAAEPLGWQVPTNGVARAQDTPVVLFSGRRVLLSPDAPIYLPAPGEPWHADPLPITTATFDEGR